MPGFFSSDRTIKQYNDEIWHGESLKKDEKVALVGFGSFSVSERSARSGRNPQTGKTIQIPAKKVVRFKAGAELEGQL